MSYMRQTTRNRWPNHALKRTRPSRSGCNPTPSWAGSLSSDVSATMRSPRTSTLLGISIPLLILGPMSVAPHVGRGRLFFAPDAEMWRVNWPSYICIIPGSLLLLFAFTRFIFRSLRR